MYRSIAGRAGSAVSPAGLAVLAATAAAALVVASPAALQANLRAYVGANETHTQAPARMARSLPVEQRRFTTLTNVMRANHDTAKSTIGNVRP